jgi:hypothetical protein
MCGDLDNAVVKCPYFYLIYRNYLLEIVDKIFSDPEISQKPPKVSFYESLLINYLHLNTHILCAKAGEQIFQMF